VTVPAVVVDDVDVLVGRARRLRDSPGRALLGIAGPPGSGKSTLAALIRDRLASAPAAGRGRGGEGAGRGPAGVGPAGVAILPMDGYHLSNAELAARGLADRKGAPETFDAEAFVRLLEAVRHRPGEEHRTPGFDRASEETVPGRHRLGPGVGLVLVEGNYLLVDRGPWARIRPLLTECWFLDVPTDVLVGRLLDRHRVAKGGPAGAARWVRTNDLPNARLVAAHAAGADVVVRPRAGCPRAGTFPRPTT
jgi:pantothenate kinase